MAPPSRPAEREPDDDHETGRIDTWCSREFSLSCWWCCWLRAPVAPPTRRLGRSSSSSPPGHVERRLRTAHHPGIGDRDMDPCNQFVELDRLCEIITPPDTRDPPHMHGRNG